MGLEGISS